MAKTIEDLDLEGVVGFEIGLSETGDEGSSYRTQNDPSRLFQRSNITQRKGAVDIRCVGDVMHGHLDRGQGPATLIVYDFQFLARKPGRRIQFVDLEFLYSAGESGKDPEVMKIAPRGRMIAVPTRQSENFTKGGEAKAGGSVMGVELGGSLKWEKSITRETSDATTIVGTIDLKGRNYGSSNSASWTLLENESVQTGVPGHFRTAVLLRRDSDEQFQSTFKIKASADLRSSLTRLFGSTPKDDPILYEPSLPPTNNLKLAELDLDNLDAVELQELSIIEFANGVIL